MAKNYELRKIWGIGPFKRRTGVGTFESEYVAMYVMAEKVQLAKKRGKKLSLEVVDRRTGQVLHRKKAK